MEKIMFSLGAIAAISFSSFGQPSEGFNHQIEMRNGIKIINNKIGVISKANQEINNESIEVYQETIALSNNLSGYVDFETDRLETSDGLKVLVWSGSPGFKGTTVELSKATNHMVTETIQLMNVTYPFQGEYYNNPITKENVEQDIVQFNSNRSVKERLDIVSRQATYTIGLWPELGGYVFLVSEDGKHGLVAETQDQGQITWYQSQNEIPDLNNHSVDGKEYSDWRMPTSSELNEMYLKKEAIGGFTNVDYGYWSSEDGANLGAWIQSLANSGQSTGCRGFNGKVRAVRTF